MDVGDAIREAEAVLPGEESEAPRDPRWQAVIRVGAFVETEPEAVWEFTRRWGRYPDEDLRTAVATCLLEHLLEHHFRDYFTWVEELVLADPLFADTFGRCWAMGQAEEPGNAERFAALQERVG